MFRSSHSEITQGDIDGNWGLRDSATTAVFTFGMGSANNDVYIPERLLLKYDFWRKVKDGKKKDGMVSRGISGEAFCSHWLLELYLRMHGEALP
ncbi:hypothetical protein [Cohnella silvisoli]|uniref:Uncharacterized protein n=1 Tax=Cohnella silvisoli TaxID=2873699 RepID=A0ABV1KLW1_9BACL|nr:hypothetical protein [Cohnella silvisoli]MCD9020596.1 hypothetical protein [Cohnella silvisoli]